MTQLRDVWFVAEGGAKLSLSDAGLIHLSQLPRLESVVLVGVGISDAGLSHLGRLQHLKQVLLIRTAVTEDGFKRLQGTLPDCKVIWRPK